MTEFANNNTKNASTEYTLFKLNCGKYPQISYEKDINLCSRSKSVEKLVTKLKELMIVCRKKLQHAQELQKHYHDTHAKLRSYSPGNKVWLNSKYIKTKQNHKLEAKFLGPFRVLHPMGK